MSGAKSNKNLKGHQNVPVELSFFSSTKYRDPFNEVDFDALFTDPDGNQIIIPGFWAGKSQWKVRFASPIIGIHSFKTVCSDKSNTDLSGAEGHVEIKQYKGKNSLYRHGSLRIGDDKIHLEHADGTPFFWLGDTWWKALTGRCKWPEVFKTVTKDRADKGFTVIQIAVGLGPEVPFPGFDDDFEKLEFNEGGFCWDKEYNSINPDYFNYADIKIKWLVESGLVPCIFGPWGYYLHFLGVEKIKKHWRYLIARWGSYPVIWCLAGEARLPYYDFLFEKDTARIERIKEEQTKGWEEVSIFIKKTDPFKNLTTLHPSPGDDSYSTRDIFEDPELFDIDMLQTGHSDFNSLPKTFETLHRSLELKPLKPVINAEPCYEGIMGASLQNTQRFLFWSNILSGTSGHSYGTDGIWTFRSEENYMGWLGRWTMDKWQDGMNLPGSYQIGLGKKLLEKYQWQKFKPNSEWVIPHSDKKNLYYPYCAGIKGVVRFIYIPGIYLQKRVLDFFAIKITGIEKNSDYTAFFFNPRNGDILERQDVEPDRNGNWSPKKYGWFNWPSMEDWVLIMENKNSK